MPVAYDETALLSKVVASDGCWEWDGTHDEAGYTRVRFQGKMWKAHRLIYTILKGEIPEGMTLDHLCRNRGCVRPDHLEPVSLRDNILRGGNSIKMCCINGHPLDAINSYQRFCRTCHNDAARRYRARKNQK